MVAFRSVESSGSWTGNPWGYADRCGGVELSFCPATFAEQKATISRA